MSIDPNSPTGAPPAPTFVPTADDRTWGMLAHLSALVAMWLGGFSFLGPLVVWLVKRNQSQFINDQAKEALNFQIAGTIGFYLAGVSILICIGWVLLPALVIAVIIYSVIGGMEANKGVYYRYPYTLRLIK